MLTRKSGFTIVELLIVIVVIGILATITIVAFSGVSRKATDAVVKSDGTKLGKSQELYGSSNNNRYVAWFSGDAPPSGLTANVSGTNIADIVVSADQKQYCIRIVNTKATYSTLDTAYIVEQPAGVCASLPASDAAIAATTPPVTSGWKVIAADCAIRYDDKAYCWGDNSYQRIGNGTSTSSSTPLAVTTSGALSGKTVKSIVSNSLHTCAIASDDKAYCWGDNMFGELGLGNTNDSNVPVAVNTLGGLSGKFIKSISVAEYSTCALTTDGIGFCWGANWTGNLGYGSTSDTSYPSAISTSGVLSGKTLLALSAGYQTTCAIASDNNAYCWGGNVYGELGIGSTVQNNAPVAVNTAGALSGKTIKKITSGRGVTCAVASDDNAYCWGQGGALGTGNNTASSVPVAVSTSGALAGKTIKSIVSNPAGLGQATTCVIASDNNAYCWGGNNYGQLGIGSTTQSNAPVAVNTAGALSGKTIKSIMLTDSRTCAIASDNNAYCWGQSAYGQFSNGTTTSTVPVIVNVP